MRLLRPLLLLLVGVSLLASVPAARAGESALTFDQAKDLARERGVPVVVDFFTDWCVYCKHFDRDKADAASGIAQALESVVFVSIDAEKGEGIELAKTYGVRGFPTYAVLDANGELIESWAGYGGPDHFLPAFQTAMSDLTTFAQKKERYAANPTAADAQTLARIADAQGEAQQALDLYRKARELDPGLDLGTEILYAAFGVMRRDASFGFAGFKEVAMAEADAENASTATVVAAAQMLMSFGPRYDEPEVGLPYLERALAAVEKDPDAVDARTRDQIRIDGLLKIRHDADAAVALKKQTMPEGWTDSASDINAFAWWCFENKVNLEEASQLARRAVEIAEPGKERAMVLDTAAELCNLLGNCREAVTLVERAVAEQPSDDYYKKQLDRFQKILAESE